MNEMVRAWQLERATSGGGPASTARYRQQLAQQLHPMTDSKTAVRGSKKTPPTCSYFSKHPKEKSSHLVKLSRDTLRSFHVLFLPLLYGVVHLSKICSSLPAMTLSVEPAFSSEWSWFILYCPKPNRVWPHPPVNIRITTDGQRHWGHTAVSAPPKARVSAWVFHINLQYCCTALVRILSRSLSIQL